MCKQEEDLSNIVARVDSPGGGSLIKGVEMLVGHFELNPQRRSIWAWPNLSLTPKRDHSNFLLHEWSNKTN